MKARRFRIEVKVPGGDETLAAYVRPAVLYEFDAPDGDPIYLAVLHADAELQEGRDLMAWQGALPRNCRLIVIPQGAEFTVIELVAVDPLPADAVRRFPGIVETLTCGSCGLTADQNWAGWWTVVRDGCDHLCAHCYATERPQDYEKKA